MGKIQPEKCKHENWLFITNSTGDRSGISKCTKCGLWLTHEERLSWKSPKNQKIISSISIVLSIVAIIVSITALVLV